MDDKIKKQQRDIAINYIVTELVRTNYIEHVNYYLLFFSLLKKRDIIN